MESFYVISLYVTFMAGVFTAFYNTLSKSATAQDCQESIDETYQLDFTDMDSYLVRKVKGFCDTNHLLNKDIIVSITGDIQSMALVSILKYLYQNNTIHVVFVNHYQEQENYSELSYFLQSFCKDNELKYHSFHYTVDKNVLQIDTTNKIREFVYECCENVSKKVDCNIIFQAHDMSNTYNNIFDSMLTGKDFKDITMATYTSKNSNSDCNYYHPFYNIETKKIESFVETHDIPHDFTDLHKTFKQLKKYTIFNEIAPLLDYTYPEWKDQLLLLCHEKVGYENALEVKLEPLYSEFKYCKYGFTFNMTNDYIPFKIWRKLLTNAMSNYQVNVDNMLIEKIYFSCNTTDTIIQGELTENWRFYFENMKLIAYDYTQLQQIFETMDEYEHIDSNQDSNQDCNPDCDYVNPLNNFLDGYFHYTNSEGNNDSLYVSINYNMLVENSNIPLDLLANFRFKNYNKKNYNKMDTEKTSDYFDMDTTISF